MESDAETPAQPRASPPRCDQKETPAQRGPPTPPVLTFLGAPTLPGLHARVLCAPRRLGARAHGRSRSLAQAGPHLCSPPAAILGGPVRGGAPGLIKPDFRVLRATQLVLIPWK